MGKYPGQGSCSDVLNSPVNSCTGAIVFSRRVRRGTIVTMARAGGIKRWLGFSSRISSFLARIQRRLPPTHPDHQIICRNHVEEDNTSECSALKAPNTPLAEFLYQLLADTYKRKRQCIVSQLKLHLYWGKMVKLMSISVAMILMRYEDGRLSLFGTISHIEAVVL